MDEKLKVVQPYGFLYIAMETFLLIKPDPVPGDSWEGDNCYRFVAVPSLAIAVEQVGNETYKVYDYARHIVTNNFTIEYLPNMEYICVRMMDEISLNKYDPIKEEENDKETDDTFPF